MSFIKETFLLCDGCETSFGVDDRAMAYYASMLRRDAKKEGWKQIKGKDYCPECVKNKIPEK